LLSVGVTQAAAPQPSLHQMAATTLSPELSKYAARCALPADQVLAFRATDGRNYSFPGFAGLAPEWANGLCDDACQEKVSSCLAAFTNRTGKHVNIQLVSAAPTMVRQVGADGDDRIYPNQEGAFFGNYWTNEVYACQGKDVTRGAQVKRFCAASPASCNTVFNDAGRCSSACNISCTDGPGGHKVCSAVSCRDPKGRVWQSPMTVFFRNKIEPANADLMTEATPDGDDLVKLTSGAEATYRSFDFGEDAGQKKAFVATLKETTPGARLEVWVDGRIKVATLKAAALKTQSQELSASLSSAHLRGRHDVTLKVTGDGQVGRLAAIEIR